MIKRKTRSRVIALLCTAGILLASIPLFVGAQPDGAGEFIEVPFDSVQSIERNFDSHFYLKPVKSQRGGEDPRASSFGEHWELKEDDGGSYIGRKSEALDGSRAFDNMAQLTYKTPYKNFELELEY